MNVIIKSIKFNYIVTVNSINQNWNLDQNVDRPSVRDSEVGLTHSDMIFQLD
jgi:hypothetical protein